MTNAAALTAEELATSIRAMWAKRGHSIPEKEWMGVKISDLVAESAKRSNESNRPFVDLWIAILDEQISWFVSLQSVFMGSRKDGFRTDFERSVIVLLAKIISDSLAIRMLVNGGFDISARTILRTLSEYMEVLVALLHRPDFAGEFVKSDTPESAQQFWQSALRGGKIRRRVEAAWLEIFDNNNDSASWFANWGRGALPLLSGLAHPSFSGGVFSAIPLQTSYVGDNWLGFLGEKSDMSAETIYIYSQFSFPIFLLSQSFPFEESEYYSFVEYEESNELHKHVKIGRTVIASIILSIGSGKNDENVRPNLDVSIFPERQDATVAADD